MHAVANDKNDTDLRDPGPGARLSELPAENKPEGFFDLHESRAELL